MDVGTWVKRKFAKWLEPELRAYSVGNGVGGDYESAYGHSNDDFSPAKYGEYIATSNPVYVCSTLRADLLVEMPLKLVKVKNGSDVEVDSGPSVDLLKKVNPFWTLSRLLKMTSYALDLWGVSFWFLERGASGKGTPREIWWARPDRVRVIVDPSKYIQGFAYTPPGEIEPEYFSTDETIWMPNPNPFDEFNGLAPLAAARLAADLNNAGMQANKRIFDQGVMLGGMLIPEADVDLTREQAQDLEKQIDRRFSGQDKAHKIGVLRYAAKLDTTAISPKDAEFLGMLKWTLEDVARAYRIPQDLIGGQRTYENVEASMKMVWMLAIKPHGRFVAEELTEKYLPMFPGAADEIKFDDSGIEVLQEDKGEIVTQIVQLAEKGVPLNKLLKVYMPNLLPEDGKGYPWGDVWWSQFGSVPVKDAEGTPVSQTTQETSSEDSPAEPDRSRTHHRGVEYGSGEHERLYRSKMRRQERLEAGMIEQLVQLFTRQRDSVIDRLKSGSRSIEEIDGEPFDMNKWIKTYREEIREEVERVFAEVGQDEIDGLAVNLHLDLSTNNVAVAVERQAQRFAVEVNQETWDAIRSSLSEGISEGEGLVKIEARLNSLFNTWMDLDHTLVDKQSRIEMIARTEIKAASTSGSLEGVRQTGLNVRKAWLSALQPHRTRDSHAEAHMRYQKDPIPLDQDFEVGGCVGPGPGMTGCPSEDINCLCDITYEVLD